MFKYLLYLLIYLFINWNHTRHASARERLALITWIQVLNKATHPRTSPPMKSSRDPLVPIALIASNSEAPVRTYTRKRNLIDSECPLTKKTKTAPKSISSFFRTPHQSTQLSL